VRDFARFLIWLPIAAADLLWEWLTRDEFDQFIAEQRKRLIDLAEGE
jgi:hypothetical protein